MSELIKPTLFGYGITTKAIAKALGGGCIFFDDKTDEPYYDEDGNHILPSHLFDPDASELEVTTPSLRPEHPLIKSSKNLLSEYDYMLTSKESPLLRADMPLPFQIWISGTNGKTTTTQMLTHLLSRRGAVSGGNIGTPLAELDHQASIWVLESSSYTLHYTSSATPNIYLLLPITPDHLDWHGDAESYEEDKLRPLRTMREGELALVPKGLNLPTTDAFVVEYDSIEFLAEYFHIEPSKIVFKAAFLEDAMLALAITRVLYDEVDYDLINSFKLDANRQEELRDSRGRLWVNDTKATNIDAAIQALKAYHDHHIHLIAGGDDKGVDLKPFFEAMQKFDLTLYTIGSNSKKELSLAKEYGIEAIECGTLDIAVKTIDERLESDGVGMLSPAAASFDQFKSYKERGELFIKFVNGLS
ncbi:UDP-N-acetylmuramoylalanine--D-glutamate ligase [hydrothermal vent metagenome]|uniref:UDP-N-acetylmuramoylalanine--D-glutamate ligase n=1 Tax=hydrothermal vent metagenome TaxID=652676 RepID=A0A1W1BZT8_9ZZZZ